MSTLMRQSESGQRTSRTAATRAAADGKEEARVTTCAIETEGAVLVAGAVVEQAAERGPLLDLGRRIFSERDVGICRRRMSLDESESSEEEREDCEHGERSVEEKRGSKTRRIRGMGTHSLRPRPHICLFHLPHEKGSVPKGCAVQAGRDSIGRSVIGPERHTLPVQDRAPQTSRRHVVPRGREK